MLVWDHHVSCDPLVVGDMWHTREQSLMTLKYNCEKGNLKSDIKLQILEKCKSD